MPKVLVSSLLLSLCVTAAFAQRGSDPDQYNGKWKVIIQQGAAKPRVARLLLTSFSGTWYNAATTRRTKAKICDGKAFPVTVEDNDDSGLEFTAFGTSISAECPDITVTVQRVDSNLLQGVLKTGESVKLLRE